MAKQIDRQQQEVTELRKGLATLNRKLESQRREIHALKGELQDRKIVESMLRMVLADLSGLTPEQVDQFVKDRMGR